MTEDQVNVIAKQLMEEVDADTIFLGFVGEDNQAVIYYEAQDIERLKEIIEYLYSQLNEDMLN